ncbi:7 transmembrane receptor (rhodopsin family) domain-containing protein [Ditylenchus destructor]|nr:7 transmembrane receptor (rhodopsin family) domain-containing protein [Ditylenchus destructor]
MEQMRQVSVEFSIFIGILLSLVTIIGLLANLVVVIAVLGNKKMRKSPMNILLMNLAIADFCYILNAAPLWSPVALYGHGGWYLPIPMCTVQRYLHSAFVLVSICTYLVISVERYFAIVYPMKAVLWCTRGVALMVSAGIWFVILLFQYPYVWCYHGEVISSAPGMARCANFCLGTTEWITFKWIEFFLTYPIPLIISVVMYTKICRVLWSHNKALRQDKLRKQDTNQLDQVMAARRNIVKMLITCVVVFFICYTPMVSYFLWGYLVNNAVQLPIELVLFTSWLVLFVSAFNPFIYALFSHSFRDRVRQILPCGSKGGLTSQISGKTQVTDVKSTIRRT